MSKNLVKRKTLFEWDSEAARKKRESKKLRKQRLKEERREAKLDKKKFKLPLLPQWMTDSILGRYGDY